MGAAHATSQLVELRQTELVGPVNNNGVSAGDVDTGFYNRGAHQDIETLVVEVRHDTFQVALAHLAVSDAHPRFGHQLAQLPRDAVDVFDLVIEVIHLAATQDFPQDGLLYRGLIILTNKG